MRPIMAIAIWIILVGGFSLYLGHRETAPPVREQARPRAEGVYSIEIATTFAVEPDPFSLRIDDTQRPASLRVKLNGKEILRRTERIEAGTPIRLDAFPGVTDGANEFYIEAAAVEQTGHPLALRLHVRRDGQPLAERVFWSEPGGKLTGTFLLRAGETSPGEDGHGD